MSRTFPRGVASKTEAGIKHTVKKQLKPTPGELEARGKMNILEKTFLRLQSLYEKEGLDPGPVVKIALKPGWTAVLGTKGLCGTAFRFSGPHKVYETPEIEISWFKELIGRNLMEMAGEHIASPLIPVRSFAIAALSALSQPLLTPASLAKRGLSAWNGDNYVQKIVTPDDIVTLVGYGGMVENVIGRCRELHVADMRPPQTLLTTIIGEEVEYEPRQLVLHGAEDDESLFARSDVVIITASSLVNGTIDELLHFAANARSVGLYGPSASLIPDVLFEEGVDFVMSHHVHDPHKFTDTVIHDMNMEQAIRKYQRYQVMLPPGAP